jgi:hypothetical protein
MIQPIARTEERSNVEKKPMIDLSSIVRGEPSSGHSVFVTR